MEEKLIYVVHVAKKQIITMPWETGEFGCYSKRKNVSELFNDFTKSDDILIIATCSTVDKAVKCRDKFVKTYRLYKVDKINDGGFDLYYKHLYQDCFGNAVAITITSKYLDSDEIVYVPYKELKEME